MKLSHQPPDMVQPAAKELLWTLLKVSSKRSREDGETERDGRTPNGWFLLGKIPLEWMMTGGCPILGNPRIYVYIYTYCNSLCPMYIIIIYIYTYCNSLCPMYIIIIYIYTYPKCKFLEGSIQHTIMLRNHDMAVCPVHFLFKILSKFSNKTTWQWCVCVVQRCLPNYLKGNCDNLMRMSPADITVNDCKWWFGFEEWS